MYHFLQIITTFQLLSGLFAVDVYALPSSPQRRMLGLPTGKTLLLHSFDRPWILKSYDDPSNITPADKTVFAKNLDSTVALEKAAFGDKGDYNAGVYLLSHDYEGHKAGEVAAKILQKENNAAYAEVKALKTIGLFIGAGKLKLPPKDASLKIASATLPVVLMRRMHGEPLDETEEWKKAKAEHDDKHCMIWMAQTMDATCKQVVQWAVEKQFVHADFHKKNENVIMKDGKVQSVNIFDVGPPRTFIAKSGTPPAAVVRMVFCGQTARIHTDDYALAAKLV
ncbi:hypothetical protein D9757_007941 [Collybiopsis confluens]|uniref:Protein kinase domain-containing protein n=1 Tax=Collybiopsis confluens TaxID=2823264 RepID=A0A8H5M4D5_9AGAR|nr:hypothetical protein D9757_007941 [Collybiopsis confluens]